MLGDTAVMVHPEDERYAHLVGRTVRLPLTGAASLDANSWREIPIIADAYVDREFGTGVVKVTPAHDFNDYAVGQRHGLPLIAILTLDARSTTTRPPATAGLDRYEARDKIVADLEALRPARVGEAAPADGAARRPHRTRSSSRCSPTSGSWR